MLRTEVLPPRLVRYGIADEEAWDVGLPCGGEISVLVQADVHEEFAALARADGRGALVTDLGSGERWLVAADPAFAPLTRGMQAALPHTDHLLPGNSLASLQALADLMEGIE